MKKFEEMTMEEQKEIATLFVNWLRPYTHEVISAVMEKREEIINNEFAMNLLKELKVRTEKEEHDFRHSIGNLFRDYDTFKEFNPHSHPISHSNSYRDVLYDMFIKNR